MISQTKLKHYSSLLQKKYRQEEKKFIVEGKKLVEEGIQQTRYKCEVIFITNEFNEKNEAFVFSLLKDFPVEIIRNIDFKRLCDTQHPQGIAAVFQFPINEEQPKLLSRKIVYMENIADPGNLGTIIRTCDWFGFGQILLSTNCVELFNPKVIRASMGSIFHLSVSENVELPFLTNLKKLGFEILCSDLEGKIFSEIEKPEKLILCLSSEADGPSQELIAASDYKITIPQTCPTGRREGNAESLNVASASAILLYYFS
ncbi:MAG: RNA methyltransferase [Ignavibacteria bacterium]|nr:RNA methyltransferase [Ignavibacteria bacterium]